MNENGIRKIIKYILILLTSSSAIPHTLSALRKECQAGAHRLAKASLRYFAYSGIL